MLVPTVTEAKAQLSMLIEKVLKGEEVLIGKAGKPIVKLTRYEENARPARPGALRGQIRIAEDFDSLPDDIAAAFGMRDSDA